MSENWFPFHHIWKIIESEYINIGPITFFQIRMEMDVFGLSVVLSKACNERWSIIAALQLNLNWLEGEKKNWNCGHWEMSLWSVVSNACRRHFSGWRPQCQPLVYSTDNFRAVLERFLNKWIGFCNRDRWYYPHGKWSLRVIRLLNPIYSFSIKNSAFNVALVLKKSFF